MAAIAVIWMLLGKPETIDPDGPVEGASSVFLVPGYGGGEGSLQPLKTEFEKRGYQVYILDIGEGKGDLGEYGKSLASKILESTRDTGGSVHVVGYSAGGVIARAALSPDIAPRIGRIVTLGSPHSGTSIASVGVAFGGAQCPLACQQLARDSDFLNSLPVAGNTERWLSVYSPQDEVVVPTETAILDGSTVLNTEQLCKKNSFTHGELPENPEIIAAVINFIDTGRLASPLPGCQ